jgi:hypothetical protein
MKLKRNILILIIATGFSFTISGQQLYKIDASKVMQQPEKGIFKMGNPGQEGEKIEVNSLYLTKNEKPLLPVMGEMHFSRINPKLWEDYILKMKACGINIVSTYLFWNQHEEIEGQFDWEGEKDIRAFVQLCAKHHMYVVPRLGPWSHGEARNGGTPDWILKKKLIKNRSNDIVYQQYVKRYFSQIAKQLNGLYYKDGGPIIGIQLENEYWYGKEGEPHIKWLKETAVSLGIDVPFYTVTGWGNGSVPPFEVIPLWGAYADAPWAENTDTIFQPENYVFDSFRDNKNIGNDRKAEDEYMSYGKYPYFTCEIGVGVQNTYHRRLAIDAIDGLAMMIAKLGSGSNLLGYYTFTGATQFRGQLFSTEEEQEITGYWSRVPLKSYDFQTAIRESGEISSAYNEVKTLHYFVHETGETLATMLPVLAPKVKNSLQLAVRSNNYSGFLFGINYARYIPHKNAEKCQFQVKFKNETLVFPQTEINIPDSALFIWPMNYQLEDIQLKYATAQLLGKVDNVYLFFQNSDIPVELAFDSNQLENIEASSGKIVQKTGMHIVTGFKPGRSNQINLKTKTGSDIRVVVLTYQEAKNCWLLDHKGTRECYLFDGGMYENGENVIAYSSKTHNSILKLNVQNAELFQPVTLNEPDKKQLQINIQPCNLLADALWLESADFNRIEPYKQRYHRFFFKEFSLNNPSRFRKAILYIYPETDCRLNLNDTWVRQPIKAGQLNTIDLTGYVTKGENLLYLDFPYTLGLKRFAARMVVEYYNYDRIEFSTDLSWTTNDAYTYPSLLKPFDPTKAPVVAATPDFASDIETPEFSEWNITVPYGSLDKVQNTVLKLKYSGDRAELYNGYTLSADQFNDNRTWNIGLRQQEQNVEGKTLRLIIYCLSKDTKIFFDVAPGKEGFQKPEILDFKTISQYQITVE